MALDLGLHTTRFAFASSRLVDIFYLIIFPWRDENPMYGGGGGVGKFNWQTIGLWAMCCRS